MEKDRKEREDSRRQKEDRQRMVERREKETKEKTRKDNHNKQSVESLLMPAAIDHMIENKRRSEARYEEESKRAEEKRRGRTESEAPGETQSDKTVARSSSTHSHRRTRTRRTYSVMHAHSQTYLSTGKLQHRRQPRVSDCLHSQRAYPALCFFQ